MPKAKQQHHLQHQHEPSDSAAKSSAAAVRIRENQRRSRARRKEYVEGMQRKLQEYETKGVAATLDMQQAARDVAIENSRLRLLLAHRGVSGEAVDMFLQSFHGQEDDGNVGAAGAGAAEGLGEEAHVAAAAARRIATAESIAALGRTSSSSTTMATLFPEHAHVDKLAVLASASIQQSSSSASSSSTSSPTEFEATMSPDDYSTATGLSTGPVTPNSSNLGAASSPADPDFDSPLAMSSDAAAQIIAQMQGCGLREDAKGTAQHDYLVQNPAFLKILEAASIFD